MIKDVMGRADGTAAEVTPLSAAVMIAELFEGRIIGLFLNLLPPLMLADGDEVRAARAVEAVDWACDVGNRVEQALSDRLTRLPWPSVIRRFDVFPERRYSVGPDGGSQAVQRRSSRNGRLWPLTNARMAARWSHISFSAAGVDPAFDRALSAA
jgi:hypothetical protein